MNGTFMANFAMKVPFIAFRGRFREGASCLSPFRQAEGALAPLGSATTTREISIGMVPRGAVTMPTMEESGR
jgi:hypothetical protein